MTELNQPEHRAFYAQRSRLLGIAYGVLGSHSEAEDVVQDVYERWTSADRRHVQSPPSYLARMTTRAAIDQLRSARVRREHYVGPWLPEPIVSHASATSGGLSGSVPDPAASVELAQSLSLALMVTLETLAPVERAAFILREVFGLDYAEVAAVIDKSEANARQIVSRAKTKVRRPQRRFQADPEHHRQLVRHFAAAVASGNVDTLTALLARDIVLTSDGGGVVTAARRPVQGNEAVARFFTSLARKAVAKGRTVRAAFVEVNGMPGLLVEAGDEVSVFDFDVATQNRSDQGAPSEPMSEKASPSASGSQGLSRIVAIRVVRNPDKLGAVRLPW